MSKNIKYILLMVVISFILFYPVAYAVKDVTILRKALTLVVNTVFCAGFGFLYSKEFGFKFYIVMIPALLFMPSIDFIYTMEYSDFATFYLLISFVGGVIGHTYAQNKKM